MKKVLVIEDLLMFQMLAEMYLREYAEVITVGTIREAKEIIENTSQDIDAIILDMNIPVAASGDMGNTTVLIPSIHQYRNEIPIFTASADDSSNQILSQLGCIKTNKSTALFACKRYFQQSGKLC